MGALTGGNTQVFDKNYGGNPAPKPPVFDKGLGGLPPGPARPGAPGSNGQMQPLPTSTDRPPAPSTNPRPAPTSVDRPPAQTPAQAAAAQQAAIAALLQQFYAPQITSSQQAQAQLQAQMAALNGNYGAAKGQAQALGQNQLAQNNVAIASNNDQYAINKRNLGEIGNHEALTNWWTKMTKQYLAQQQGFVGRDFGLNTRNLDLTYNRQKAQLGDQREAAISDATARGATTFGGLGGKGGQLDDNKRDLAFAAREHLLGTTGATLQKDKDTAGVQRQLSQALLDDAEKKLTYGERRALIKDRTTELNRTAQLLGLKGSELQIKIQQGLTQLNLQHTTSLAQLMDAMNSQDATQKQIAQQIIAQTLGFQGS